LTPQIRPCRLRRFALCALPSPPSPSASRAPSLPPQVDPLRARCLEKVRTGGAAGQARPPRSLALPLRRPLNPPSPASDPPPKVLIIYADHEQNASTSTVRTAGSSQANPFACVASGIAALWGPAHGGANEAVLRMLLVGPRRWAGGHGMERRQRGRFCGAAGLA
jgi:hypothetical protein